MLWHGLILSWLSSHCVHAAYHCTTHNSCSLAPRLSLQEREPGYISWGNYLSLLPSSQYTNLRRLATYPQWHHELHCLCTLVLVGFLAVPLHNRIQTKTRPSHKALNSCILRQRTSLMCTSVLYKNFQEGELLQHEESSLPTNLSSIVWPSTECSNHALRTNKKGVRPEYCAHYMLACSHLLSWLLAVCTYEGGSVRISGHVWWHEADKG